MYGLPIVVMLGPVSTAKYRPVVPPGNFIALSGTASDGDDILLLSGDASDGADGLLISET